MKKKVVMTNAPVVTLVENGVEPKHFSFRPQESPPHDGIDRDGES